MAFFTQIVFRRKDAPLFPANEFASPTDQRKKNIVLDRAQRTFGRHEADLEVIPRNGADYGVRVRGLTFIYHPREEQFYLEVTDTTSRQSRVVRSAPIRRREDIPRALEQAKQIFHT